jgi:predicted PurR-regulated permease PerM
MTTRQRALSWIGAFALFIGFVLLFESILLPFLLGFAVAYFLDPVCDRLEGMNCSRTVATSLVTAGFFLICILAFALLVPVLYKQVIQFTAQLPDLITRIEVKARPLIENFADIKAENEEGLHDFLRASLGSVVKMMGNIGSRLVSGLGAVANLFALLIVTPVVAFYLLRDWDRLVDTVDSWLPRAHAEIIREQFRLINGTLAGFVRGQFSVCLLLGVFYAIGLTAFGLPFGAIVGLATGLLSFIPYIGMLSGFAFGLGLAIANFDDPIEIGLIIGVFLVGQVLEGNFLTPKLVGERVNLHAVWILFALMGGGAIFGFVGIMLAVPVAAVIGVMVRFMLGQYLASPLYGSAKIGTSEDQEKE